MYCTFFIFLSLLKGPKIFAPRAPFSVNAPLCTSSHCGNAVNGFRKTGINPFDPCVFREEDFMAAEMTDRAMSPANVEPTVPGPSTAPDEPAVPGPSTSLDEPTVPGLSTSLDEPTVPGPSTSPDEPAVPGPSASLDEPKNTSLVMFTFQDMFPTPTNMSHS